MVLVVSGSHAAEPRISFTMDQLKSMQVDPLRFSLGAVSADGSTLVGVEKIKDPKLKAKGQVWKVQIFGLDFTGQNAKVRSIIVPTTQLEQLAVSPDGKWALGLSDFGTRFIAINLVEASARIVFQNKANEPGFRAQPEVIWWERGKFHVPGYYYEKDQTVECDAIASVDLQGNGLAALQKVRDISVLHRQTAGFALQQWQSSDQVYFGLVKPDNKMHLVAALGDQMLPVDAAMGYGGLAVGQDRVIYAARWDKKTTGVVLHDVAMNRKWRIGDGSKLYNYLYMSADGSTVLVSNIDTATQKMTTWYAHEQDNFALHPVPGIDKVTPGTIRFSPGGEVIAFYSPKGLLIEKIPGR